MDRWQYLKLALQARCYRKIAWIISAMSLVQEGAEEYLKDPYPYRLVQTPTGYRYVSPEDGSLQPIKDSVAGQALFRFQETMEIDETWCPNATGTATTQVGNLLVNWICLVEAFGKKYPFITGRIKVGAIEETIAKTLSDTPKPGEARDDKIFYVDEMLVFSKHLAFLEALSPLCVYAATPKNIVAPAGRDVFKAQLLKQYGDQLNDPTVLAAFEKALKDYDEAWLKDDPSNGILLSGKVKDIARKNMYLTMGSNLGFEESGMAPVVPNALDEGWPKDPQQFTALMNNARAAAYVRAKETEKGGVTAKILLRAIGNFNIVDEDCGTQRGLVRVFTKATAKQLLGRSVRKGASWVYLAPTDDPGPYLDQKVIVRSPMYCKSPKDTVCKACIGSRLADNPQGLSNAVTEISSIILTASLKARHGVVLSMAHYDVQSALT